MSGSRVIRQHVLSLLPASERARLRRVYERVTAPAAHAAAEFTVEGESLALVVRDGPTIRLLPRCRADVQRSFMYGESAAELHRFMAAARSPGTLFDVGANNGLFSLLYCLLNPSNRAVAFEPSPGLARTIRELATLNGVEGRLQVVAKAIAENAGERDLLLDTRGGYVQSAQFNGTAHDAWRRASIKTTTLDLAASTIAAPTIVKIDVEGYEWEALLGAAQLLAVIRPTVFLEVHLNYLQHRGIATPQVLRLLTACGYELRDLSGRRRSEMAIARCWASVLHVIAVPAAAPSPARNP